MLPDGRVLLANTVEAPENNNPDLGPLWELQIEGAGGEVLVGHPLNSTLAELLGFGVAHELWPGWVDRLARRIEAA